MADYDRYEERRRRWEEKVERRRQRWESRWDGSGRRHGSGGVFIGIFLAAIGVALLLQNLGILFIDDLWRYWPVILIALGISKMATACGASGRVWGGMVALIGGIFLADNLGYLPGHVWNYIWPAVLIMIGVGMLIRSVDRGSRWDWWNPQPPTDPSRAASGPVAGAGGVAGSSVSDGSLHNTLNEWAFFGGVRRRIDAQDFEGGEAMAIFGGIRIDLDRAAAKKEEVCIEANAMFGGIDFRVPDTWAVTVRGTGIFGGYEDKTIEPRPSEGKPTHLIISGVAVFGGVTVKN